VSDGLDNISCSRLALCADHGGAFRNTAESFAEVAAAADEWDAERMLLDVVSVVRGSQDLGLVDVVYTNGLKDLSQDRD
jgi:hypothetical protein